MLNNVFNVWIETLQQSVLILFTACPLLLSFKLYVCNESNIFLQLVFLFCQVTPEYVQMVCQRLFSNQLSESVDITRPPTVSYFL